MILYFLYQPDSPCISSCEWTHYFSQHVRPCRGENKVWFTLTTVRRGIRVGKVSVHTLVSWRECSRPQTVTDKTNQQLTYWSHRTERQYSRRVTRDSCSPSSKERVRAKINKLNKKSTKLSQITSCLFILFAHLQRFSL